MENFKNIQTISLSGVLPVVFQDSKDEIKSHVWLKKVEFQKGKTYLIEAESGTGKSSLCSYIYGDRYDYIGRIKFDDRDISLLSINDWCRLRRSSLAYLPQEMRLFPELTALENIMIKNQLTGFRTEEEIISMLEYLELADRMNYAASHLSVGQQQRVAIIRALCQPFDFLLIDEPVSHLDQRNNETVARMIEEETRKQGAAIIATSVGNNISLSFQQTLLL